MIAEECIRILFWGMGNPILKMRDMLNDEYDSDNFEQVCKVADIQVLTHKEEFKQYSSTGKLTLFGYLCKRAQEA